MSARTARWAPPVTAAAVAVAGVAIVVVPQHTASILRVLVASSACIALAAAALVALDRTEGIQDAAASPFTRTDRRRRFDRDLPNSFTRIRSELASGPVRADLAPLTPAAARRLALIAAAAFEREGLDLGDPTDQAVARSRLSPEAWAAITADRSLAVGPDRSAGPPRRRARSEEVTATVNAVLDELEGLAPRSGAS